MAQGKRYRAAVEKAPKDPVSLDRALEIVKGFPPVKFDQTVELCVWLGIDAKQADQSVRGAISLPKGIGKTYRVIAFVPEELAEAARAAGAVEAGEDELVAKVQEGWMDFDVAVAHPRAMGKVGRLGRLLGPQGKMPSPKSGTVTDKVEDAIREYAAGKIEFRNDASGNVHAVVGKMSFPVEDLKENILAFMDQVQRLKPQTSKGVYVRKVTVSGSMTPGVPVAM